MPPEIPILIGLSIFAVGVLVYALFFFGENDIRRKRGRTPRP